MKKRNPKAITEEQIRNAVRAKAKRMEDELQRNPKNNKTAQRLGEFKKLHASKLL